MRAVREHYRVAELDENRSKDFFLPQSDKEYFKFQSEAEFRCINRILKLIKR